MRRAALAVASLVFAGAVCVGSVGCRRDPSPPRPIAPQSTAVAPPAETATAPAPIPSPPPVGCTPVPWRDDDNADEATYRGKLTVVTAADGNGKLERPYIVVLDDPACLPPKGTETKTGEIQVFSGDAKLDEKIRSLVGKKVVVTGEGFVPHTSHHHRPIVVDVKTITAK